VAHSLCWPTRYASTLVTLTLTLTLNKEVKEKESTLLKGISYKTVINRRKVKRGDRKGSYKRTLVTRSREEVNEIGAK
jgi:hypothetical protein